MAAFKDSTGAAYLPTVTAGGAVPVADVGAETAGDPLALILDLLTELLDEQRATRLAVEEMVNQGSAEEQDFLANARAIRLAEEQE